MTRLEAKSTQAGKQRRCPVCYHKLRVPTAEEVAAAAAKAKEPGYDLAAGNGMVPSSAAYQTYLSIVCGVCGTRMYASPSQMGQEMVCPDCGTPARVAPPPPRPAPPSDPSATKPIEDYPVYQGEGQPPLDHKEVYQRYIPVVCPICHTRMLATVDQVGQRLICPDCETPSIVPPLEEVSHEPPPPIRRWNPADVYDTQDSPGAPAPPPPASPGAPPSSAKPSKKVSPPPAAKVAPPASAAQYVVATCPVCHTRQDVTLDQVGKALTCPDCGTRFPVPPPPARPAPLPPDPLDEIGQEYGLAPSEGYGLAAPHDPVERKPAIFDLDLSDDQEGYRPAAASTPGEERPRRELEEEWKSLNHQLREGGDWEAAPSRALPRRKPVKPAKPAKEQRASFVAGVFNFPFYRTCLLYWVALSVGLMFVVLPPVFAWRWTEQQETPDWTWATVAAVLAAFGGLLWSLMSSATCLAILQDTAEGCDEIENWPEGAFLEWLFDAVYIFVALVLAAALGFGVYRLLDLGGVPWWPRGLQASVLAGFLAFPFLLMSLLEAGSPLIPFSLPILRSLGSVWWRWLLFYLETGVLVASMAGLGTLVALKSQSWGSTIALTPVALLLAVAALMIYFRLLGRLVWCCSHVGGTGDEDPLARRDEDDLVQTRSSQE